MSKQHDGNTANKILDAPCGDLYTNSLNCLANNHFKKEKCKDAFEAYKACKKQEVATRLERRKAERAKRSLFG
ncbi:hypothetical protein WJX84_008527 [Apatococcus fuscideae]|uniref:CHCH domain-containing protein n=1 Tax=Apatococcus fuscideae TaxID=2026836 RepID=A0AAW1S0L1_9CHLO